MSLLDTLIKHMVMEWCDFNDLLLKIYFNGLPKDRSSLTSGMRHWIILLTILWYWFWYNKEAGHGHAAFLWTIILKLRPGDTKRKPPCICGMKLVSLSCNRVFISAESVGQGWCKIPGKGSCCHHRFARALARCHCKQWVPGRLIRLGVRSFRLKILQTPFLLWIVKNSGFLIIKYIWFVNFKCIYKKIKLRKNSSFNWFTSFHMLIRPDVIWKNLSHPLHHVHFTVTHKFTA